MSTTMIVIVSVVSGFVVERLYNATNRELTYWLEVYNDWRNEDKSQEEQNDKEIAAFKRISERKGRLSRSKRQGQRWLICREHRRVFPD